MPFPIGRRDRDSIGEGIRLLQANGDLAVFLATASCKFCSFVYSDITSIENIISGNAMNAMPTSDFVLALPPPVAAGRPPRLLRFSQIAPRQTHWLWPQRVALGKVTLLVGEPGIGKGSVAVDLAARVSRGSAWPDQAEAGAAGKCSLPVCDENEGTTENPLPVQHWQTAIASAAPAISPGQTAIASAAQAPLGTTIVVCAEDEQYESMPARLAAAGADLDKICAIEVDPPDDGTLHSLSPGYELAALRAALAATPDCKLVVIDPLSVYVNGRDGRQSESLPMLLFTLANLAHKYRVAIVVVAHLAGRASFRSVDRLLGSLGPACSSRSVWGIVRDPSDSKQRLMLRLDGNVAEEQAALSFRIARSNNAPGGIDASMTVKSQRGDERKGDLENVDANNFSPSPILPLSHSSDQLHRLCNPPAHGAPRVEWGAVVTTAVEQALAGTAKFRVSEQLYRDNENFITTKLRETLADGPKHREMIGMLVSGTEQQLYRAAERLGVVKRKTAYEWHWMLPEHVAKWEAEQQQRRSEIVDERKERKYERERQGRHEKRLARREKRLAEEAAARVRQEMAEFTVQKVKEMATMRQDASATQTSDDKVSSPPSAAVKHSLPVNRLPVSHENKPAAETPLPVQHEQTSPASAAQPNPPWRHKPPSIFERPPREFESDLAACPESAGKAKNSKSRNSLHEARLRDAAG
jgi:hypothetical protein